MTSLAPINHIGFVVADSAAAAEALTKAFGVTVKEVIDLPDRGVHAEFVAWGDTTFELVSIEGIDVPVGMAAAHIAVSTPNIEDTMASLADYLDGPPLEMLEWEGQRSQFCFMRGVRVQLCEVAA